MCARTPACLQGGGAALRCVVRCVVLTRLGMEGLKGVGRAPSFSSSSAAFSITVVPITLPARATGRAPGSQGSLPRFAHLGSHAGMQPMAAHGSPWQPKSASCGRCKALMISKCH